MDIRSSSLTADILNVLHDAVSEFKKINDYSNNFVVYLDKQKFSMAIDKVPDLFHCLK